MLLCAAGPSAAGPYEDAYAAFDKGDYATAMRLSRPLADQGNAEAQYNLGRMYAVGEGIAPDPAEAMRWYAMAAEQGHANAQNNLANLYESDRQFEKAAHWYRRAADQGQAFAQASFGFAYSQGRGVPVDEVEAVKYYRMAAEQGYAGGQFNLGGMYAMGRGVMMDPLTAARWVRLAADQGLGIAENLIGEFYAKGFGVTADSAEAVRWFLRAAGKDLTYAQQNLAIHYATGNGVIEDPLRAFMWFAAAAGHGGLGAAENRDRVPIDRETEVCKLISAAASGEVEAQRELSIRLHGGDGLPGDEHAARYWLRKAANAGDAWSQMTYALQLPQSDDPAIEKERVRYIALAAEQGEERALFNLGARQFLGEGIAVDLEAAAANLSSASVSGFSEARGAIEKIRPAIADDRWSSIIDKVEWPMLMIALGPLVEGHLDEVRVSQENDDGSDDAEWLQYERESANAMFLGSEDREGSILDSVFGEKVKMREDVRSDEEYQAAAALAVVTINLRNIHLSDGFPVYWKPSKERLEAFGTLIGAMDGRTWVRCSYMTF